VKLSSSTACRRRFRVEAQEADVLLPSPELTLTPESTPRSISGAANAKVPTARSRKGAEVRSAGRDTKRQKALA